MSATAELWAFAGIMALGQFSPGPDMLLLTRASLAGGARAGVVMALGIATGLTIHAALAIGGTAALWDRGGWPGEVLRWAAAAYLGWLAVDLGQTGLAGIRRRDAGEALPVRGCRRPFVRGLLCNLLNPKVVMFLAAVTAPFLRGERPAWWPWALWGMVVLEGAGLWILWALALQWSPTRAAYRRAGPWIDLGFAALLLGLAALLASG